MMICDYMANVCLFEVHLPINASQSTPLLGASLRYLSDIMWRALQIKVMRSRAQGGIGALMGCLLNDGVLEIAIVAFMQRDKSGVKACHPRAGSMKKRSLVKSNSQRPSKPIGDVGMWPAQYLYRRCGIRADRH